MKKEKIVTLGQKRLQDWLSATGRSINTFVLDARINYKIGWKYVRGLARPGLEMAVRIQNLTEGYVLCEHWMKDYLEPEPTHQKKKTNKKTHTHKD